MNLSQVFEEPLRPNWSLFSFRLLNIMTTNSGSPSSGSRETVIPAARSWSSAVEFAYTHSKIPEENGYCK